MNTESNAAQNDNTALVIGAGLGGLSAAMRLGAKGYAVTVTVLDRLEGTGGRGSSISQDGHRFDLGPTIITVPQLYEELWATCGRDFHKDVELRPVLPFYEIRWPDGTKFRAVSDTEQMKAEVAKISPGDVKGYEKFMRGSQQRYKVGYEGLMTKPMHKLWETIKVLPKFAMLRADRSIYAHAKTCVKDEKIRMALSFHPLFIGGDPNNVTSMYALVGYLEKEFGVHYAMGGVQAITDAMANVVRAQGGTIRQNSEVDEILIESGATRGVRLSSGERIASPLVVSNADAGHTYSHLLRNHTKRRWTPKKLASRRWSMGLYVWYFGTKCTAGKWSDVGHHTIVNGPRFTGLLNDIFIKGKLSDDMSLYIHRPSLTDPTVAPAGDDTFYVLSPVPHLGWDDAVDWQKEEPEDGRRMIDPKDLEHCRNVIRTGSLSFHAASKLLPASVRDPALALYAFCRLADDEVDEGNNKGRAVLDLRDRLDQAYAGTPLNAPEDRAFATIIEEFDMPRALPEALLEGLAWDAIERRYDTLSDVRGYSARVASAVGAMMCVLMRVRDENALARACDLGVAMQLTNIARDIGEDARAGRIYLPLEWMEEAKIDVGQFFANPQATSEIRRMVRKLLAEAHRLYIRSEAGISALPLRARTGIFAARYIYAGCRNRRLFWRSRWMRLRFWWMQPRRGLVAKVRGMTREQGRFWVSWRS